MSSGRSPGAELATLPRLWCLAVCSLLPGERGDVTTAVDVEHGGRGQVSLEVGERSGAGRPGRGAGVPVQ